MRLKEEECQADGLQPSIRVVVPVDLRHHLYNGRRHYVYNERGEQIGKRKLKDMPGSPQKRWESRQAFAKRTAKRVAVASK